MSFRCSGIQLKNFLHFSVSIPPSFLIGIVETKSENPHECLLLLFQHLQKRSDKTYFFRYLSIISSFLNDFGASIGVLIR